MKIRFLLALIGLTIAATTAQAGDIRWHIYPDNSMLLDDDTNGQRLVMPKEYRTAEEMAQRHYGQINPDSFTDIRKGYSLSFDIAPRRILSEEELANWTRANSTTWWEEDLLTVIYRNLERKAVAISAEDPQRARAELNQKRATESIQEPSPTLVKDLAWHNVKYSGKAATYGGENTWRFEVNDPAGSGRSFDIPVPVGSSEKAIMQAIYEACLSDSSTWVNGKRVISPSSKEMLSWVRW